ncbi:MAG: hypothetical protein CM15mP4_2150 [Candidatus Neomarinimicrobiota bacterium]|nr:MAG: hypothetical protein CM15mP4_2150 [Candidatus Neomarinimicrobiota bacterium]
MSPLETLLGMVLAFPFGDFLGLGLGSSLNVTCLVKSDVGIYQVMKFLEPSLLKFKFSQNELW